MAELEKWTINSEVGPILWNETQVTSPQAFGCVPDCKQVVEVRRFTATACLLLIRHSRVYNPLRVRIAVRTTPKRLTHPSPMFCVMASSA